ncbi:aminotransferase class I/II-fold pyridoxal phosphate-dependent enzyme [Variovorax terrae]|uniref:histidinol-phosphate transaminase n=1 Tax=Variovorax terrae TaxID=2923278 RepID=A0A9X1VVT5_9BURK|nr:aminotransferase class I/II-fold pyridoxal phosphate-dependent enzyme [Variovorax terrae]MCJ0762944.1 aminotransferase class I/II-fold pyridoxal phosphate-dependent enzyme [Variovorax terrae]
MAALTALARTHGGPDAQGVPRHDFSSNSHAGGPCPLALAAVQQADATRYPDASYAALRAQLAAFHGVAAARVVLAASASEFIFRITASVAQQGGEAVWLPPHHYGDYAQAAEAWGLRPTALPQDAALAWCCEPSSPLGAAQPGLPALVAAAAPASVVLDRAYEPLRLQGAPALDEAGLRRVWQLWTPNKALGLTGVRAAYAIAPAGSEEAAAQLERLAPSWPLGAHGVALLQAWCEPAVQHWLAGSLATLREWKARQIALCEALGWACLPSDANFFCARPGVPDLGPALRSLRAQSIKLRDCTSFGLAGQVRLAVLPPAAQDALAGAWQQIQHEQETT